MTTEHDFKHTENYVEAVLEDIDPKISPLTHGHYRTILFALRFTDACLNGDAHSDVIVAGLKAFQNGYGTPLTRMRFAHEAMTQQRATEIQKEID